MIEGDARGCKPFLEAARENLKGGRPAILSAEGVVLRTFGEIGDRGRRLAESFFGAGLGGRVVIVALENSADWIEVFYGLLLAGAVPLPCEPATAAEVAACLGGVEVGPRVVRRSPEGGISLFGGSGVAAPPGVFLMKSTSGTTSARRAILFSGEQFLSDVRQVGEGMGIRSDDVNLAAIPFTHSYGLTSLVGMLLVRGTPLVLAGDRLPRPLAAAAARASVFPGVPSHYRALAAVGPPGGKLRLCISAAAPLAARDARNFEAAWGLKIHAFYGAGECGGICFDGTVEGGLPEGFVGTPLPGVSIRETDCDEGVMIEVRSPAVGMGYWPAADGDALGAGAFRPSDILRREGRGYVIVGRACDVVNIAGRKVVCARVEGRLRAMEGVGDAVVFPLPGPGGGDSLAACVATSLSAREIRKQCAAALPPWEIPKHIFLVDALPVDARGKISRVALREKYALHRCLPPGDSVSECG